MSCQLIYVINPTSEMSWSFLVKNRLEHFVLCTVPKIGQFYRTTQLIRVAFFNHSTLRGRCLGRCVQFLDMYGLWVRGPLADSWDHATYTPYTKHRGGRLMLLYETWTSWPKLLISCAAHIFLQPGRQHESELLAWWPSLWVFGMTLKSLQLLHYR